MNLTNNVTGNHDDDNRYRYRVTLTEPEAKSLQWVGERYTSAELLCKGLTSDNDETFTITLTEPEAWKYMDTLETENGNPNQFLPPCVGGTLADKLVDLWESIT